MNLNILQKIRSFFRSQPGPEFIAQQLRRPSGRFAQTIGQKMNQVNKPLYDLTVEAMELRENDHLLEIGFGNGKFFSDLLSRGKGLKVSAVDFSKEMVAEAKERNRDLVSSGRLNIKLGSSESLPFPDATFDKVFCNMVIYFWDHPEAHLKEVHRVLKPGGKFYTGMRTPESMRYFPFVEHGFNLYETDEWENVLLRNGFSLLAGVVKKDPEIEVDGRPVCLESCCLVGKKNDKPII